MKRVILLCEGLTRERMNSLALAMSSYPGPAVVIDATVGKNKPIETKGVYELSLSMAALSESARELQAKVLIETSEPSKSKFISKSKHNFKK